MPKQNSPQKKIKRTVGTMSQISVQEGKQVGQVINVVAEKIQSAGKQKKTIRK
jgi:hypothetical protein